jgi:hypothetical protein
MQHTLATFRVAPFAKKKFCPCIGQRRREPFQTLVEPHPGITGVERYFTSEWGDISRQRPGQAVPHWRIHSPGRYLGGLLLPGSKGHLLPDELIEDGFDLRTFPVPGSESPAYHSTFFVDNKGRRDP